ncbi:MarR family transcriptional regulator [Rhizobium sp. P40RR-XXII]|uniref:MarR family winged helix-turn-helix transcriptional regulator n=1 Tax=unclassified Rhizobium TaxID=2613769 RepID=UPI001456A5B7|nr:MULTISPECIES: MarR family transcriptional regulator [unclassified Rhizobium]NLR85412.1 MarR family transcriptional regulator [Rhizobium sp. P28RR-XV]NLS20070.1 MarR family transcriptional regulator [Rhizobium sp. P40RR-XXII]
MVDTSEHVEEIWPGEGLVVSPDTVDLDVLNDTFSFFVRSLSIEVSRDWDARISDIDEMRGTGKVTALFLISKYPGIHPSTIAQVSSKDRAEIARLLTGMEKAGLIYRKAGRRDSRSWSLFITEKGESSLSEIRQRIRQSRDFLADILDEEYDQAMALLRKIYWRLVMTPRPPGGRP